VIVDVLKDTTGKAAILCYFSSYFNVFSFKGHIYIKSSWYLLSFCDFYRRIFRIEVKKVNLNFSYLEVSKGKTVLAFRDLLTFITQMYFIRLT